MGSSHKRRDKILGVLPRTAAERFLVQLANFRGDQESAKIFFDKHESILSKVRADFDGDGAVPGWFTIQVLARRLKKAWDAPDARSREWYCFQMRMVFFRWENKDDPVFKQLRNPGDAQITVYEDVPPVTPFEAVVFYFQTVIADRAKHCLHVDCPASYFIAKKRWQKYCSEECAGPANREAKRSWWHEHKDDVKKKKKGAQE